jgi:hypothetical protein
VAIRTCRDDGREHAGVPGYGVCRQKSEGGNGAPCLSYGRAAQKLYYQAVDVTEQPAQTFTRDVGAGRLRGQTLGRFTFIR